MDFSYDPRRDRPGYRFDGWFVDEARTLRLNPGANLPHQVTIYDRWVPIPYTVTYHLAHGINNRRNPKQITVESGIRKLFPPIQNDAFFEGWYWKGERVEFLPEGLHEDVELTARFSKAPIVRFETGKGARIAPKTVSPQGMLTPFRAPMRPGYVFDGWYLDQTHQTPFSFDQPIRQNLTLYAKWKERAFEIVYELQGGFFEQEPVRYFEYDSPTIWLPAPQRKGYRFLGWKDRWGKEVTNIPTQTMSKKIVTAQWQRNEPEVHAMVRKPRTQKTSDSAEGTEARSSLES